MRADFAASPEWDQVWDQDGYKRGRDLWASQLQHAGGSPYVYMNAAYYVEEADPEQAEQILLEGQRRFPATGQYSGLHWEMILSHLYAWALAGSDTRLHDDGSFGNFQDEDSTQLPNQTPFAQKVRAMLLASKDPELLMRTVEQLQRNRPNLEFSQTLIQHALALRPDRFTHIQHVGLQEFAVELRAKANPAGLGDGDRMVFLQSQLNPVRRGVNDNGEKARELLALAERNTKDPNYGTAIFLGNIALGEVAMSRGDKSEAARLLLAAADAPPTEFLSSMQIDMSLPRKLVDAGERETVAKFLDRCRKLDTSNKRLAEWAAEIRAGINPDLRPNSDLFRRAG